MKTILKKIKMIFLYLLFLILLSALIYWIYYVLTADYKIASYTKGIKTERVSVSELVCGNHDSLLNGIAEFAKLCEIVYREESNKDTKHYQGWTKLDLPIEDISPLESNRVVRTKLYYELWKLDEIGKTTFAIVFRGTHFNSDWYSNLRWFWKKIKPSDWDHYDQLEKIIDKIVISIKDSHKKTNALNIIATGHSLGGGLAQYAAYLHPEIKHVYAFDPSPVTGYYSVEKEKRKTTTEDVIIFRMYESGEGLSYIRTFMTFLYPAPLFVKKDPSLIRIRFSFSTAKNASDQHSIAHLAENLRKFKYNTE